MSLNWEMTEQDFEDVKHLLPHSVVALITVIGLEAAFHMVKVWGGTNYPISNRRRNTRQSRILHAQTFRAHRIILAADKSVAKFAHRIPAARNRQERLPDISTLQPPRSLLADILD